MVFSEYLTFDPALCAEPIQASPPASAHEILEQLEVPHVCGGPGARLLAALKHPPARAVRMASSLCPGVLPSFHEGLLRAAPFLAGTTMAAQGLALLLAGGGRLSEGSFALSLKAPLSGQARQAMAGARAVLDGLSLPLSGVSGAFHASSENIELPDAVFLAISDRTPAVAAQFLEPNSTVSLFLCPFNEDGLPIFPVMRSVFAQFELLAAQGEIRSALALSAGGLAEAIGVLCGKSGLGFSLLPEMDVFSLCALRFGGILAESKGNLPGALPVGKTLAEPVAILPRCPEIPLAAIQTLL